MSPLETPPVWPQWRATPKPANKPMNNPKQRYTVYRDNDLIASDLLSLPSIMKFVRNDALKEHSQGTAGLLCDYWFARLQAYGGAFEGPGGLGRKIPGPGANPIWILPDRRA